MKIKVGDIVTVILEPCFLNGQQGKVVLIEDDKNPDGPIGVHFDIQCRPFFSLPFKYGVDGVMRFEEADLRVDADGYTVENKANILFPNFYSVIYTLKNPIDPSKLCMHEDCTGMRSERIMVNTYGVVQEFDVCEIHSEWNGRSCDGFPCKK